MKFRVLLLFSAFLQLSLSAQVKFNPVWLENPLQYTVELDQQFEYIEIPVFKMPEKGFFKELENGYAKADFVNPSKWKAGLVNIKVSQIDIVFTKYPFKKQDWITNYHALLSERLKVLFALDPSLNDSSVEYRLVLQTDCKTEEQTKTFYHGIVIYFNLIEADTKASNKQLHQNISTKGNHPEYLQIDYDYVRKPQQKIKAKKKEKKAAPKQDCPDFSTKKRKN